MRISLAFCLWALALSADPTNLELDPEEALALRRIADFWEEGEYQIAKSQMEDFLSEFSKNPYSDTLRMALGDLSLREKSYQTALNYYAEITDPALADKILSNRMQCLYHLQWHATLADECEAYLRRESETTDEKSHLEATYFLAIALYEQCISPEKDEKVVKSLAERAKPYFESLSNSELSDEVAGAFAHLRCILKDFEGASNIYLDLAKKNDNSENLLFQAALVQSKYDKKTALQTFEEITKLAGSFAREAAYNQLILSFDLCQYEQIVSNKEIILQSVPEERKSLAHLFIGRSYLMLNQYQEASQELSAFLDLNTAHDSIRTALLHLLEAAYRASDLTILDEAIGRLKKFDSLDVELPKALFSRAHLLKKEQKLEEAKAELRSLLVQFPTFADRPLASFEITHLEFGAKQWAACREAAQIFLQEYPSHELSMYAWRYLASSSIELANQAKEFKQQCLHDLENLLREGEFLSVCERLDFQFYLAKTLFELGDADKSSSLLTSILGTEEPFGQRANAELLFAFSSRENQEHFCRWAEAALSHQADLIPIADQHLALFNSYLQRSEEYLTQAAHHLYEAFQSKADIQLPNLLWLADYSYKQYEKNPSEAKIAFDVVHFLVEKTNPYSICHETLYLEPLILKAAKLYQHFGKLAESITLLEALYTQYKLAPELSWACENELKLYLAESILRNGERSAAEELFDEIASSTVYKDRFVAEAALQSARIKQTSEDRDLTNILSTLKNLILQKNLENEPIHLEAALDYIELQTQLEAPEQRATKRLNLLAKTKADFEMQEDLLSKDYHAGRSSLEKQNQIYLSYMNYLDAQILLAKAELDSSSEEQKELQAKAKHILLQIETEAPSSLRARLKSNE